LAPWILDSYNRPLRRREGEKSEFSGMTYGMGYWAVDIIYILFILFYLKFYLHVYNEINIKQRNKMHAKRMTPGLIKTSA